MERSINCWHSTHHKSDGRRHAASDFAGPCPICSYSFVGDLQPATDGIGSPVRGGGDQLHSNSEKQRCQSDLIRCRSCLGTCAPHRRSEEHTSELQSLMRISYAVFCLK